MNRPYSKYNPEIGIPTAYRHHGQQHQLHKQPGCKAANLSNSHNAKTCSPWADHVGGSVQAYRAWQFTCDFIEPNQ